MDALVFPRTHIRPDQLHAALNCCSAVHLLRPTDGPLPDHLAQAALRGKVIVHLPPGADSGSMDQLKAAYQSWAVNRTGADIHRLAATAGRPPFFDETATAAIRQEIVRSLEPADRPDPSVFSVAQARLLLELAQDLDQQNDDIDNVLTSVDRMESLLVNDVLGHPAGPSPDPNTRSQPPIHGGSERLRAWCRLAALVDGLPRVWLTFDRPVIDDMVERFDTMIPVIAAMPLAPAAIGSGPDMVHQLASALTDAAADAALAAVAADWAGAAAGQGRLTVYRVPAASGTSTVDIDRHLELAQWVMLIEYK